MDNQVKQHSPPPPPWFADWNTGRWELLPKPTYIRKKTTINKNKKIKDLQLYVIVRVVYKQKAYIINIHT
jgi:hypothetical protein